MSISSWDLQYGAYPRLAYLPTNVYVISWHHSDISSMWTPRVCGTTNHAWSHSHLSSMILESNILTRRMWIIWWHASKQRTHSPKIGWATSIAALLLVGIMSTELSTLQCRVTLKTNCRNTIMWSQKRYKHVHTHQPPSNLAQRPNTRSRRTILPPLDKKSIKRIQQIVGNILYYVRAVDMTVLMALSTIAIKLMKATEKAMAKCLQLFDYLAYHAKAKVRFYASDMISNIHLDASYLSIYPKGRPVVKLVAIFSWEGSQRMMGPFRLTVLFTLAQMWFVLSSHQPQSRIGGIIPQLPNRYYFSNHPRRHGTHTA